MAIRDSKRSAAVAIDAALSLARMDVSAIVGAASSIYGFSRLALGSRDLAIGDPSDFIC